MLTEFSQRRCFSGQEGRWVGAEQGGRNASPWSREGVRAWMWLLGFIQILSLGCVAQIRSGIVCLDLRLLNSRHRSKELHLGSWCLLSHKETNVPLPCGGYSLLPTYVAGQPASLFLLRSGLHCIRTRGQILARTTACTDPPLILLSLLSTFPHGLPQHLLL